MTICTPHGTERNAGKQKYKHLNEHLYSLEKREARYEKILLIN